MSVRSGGLQRKSKAATEIPSSSMADIAFLLLIFFMVSTVFQSDKNRQIDWAQAEAIEKIDKKQKDILNVWVERTGSVFMNDVEYPMEDVGDVVFPLYIANLELVVSIRSDRSTPYHYIDQLTKELQSAGALKVMFAAELENTMTRQRR
jgi:biopolymer transport protein ExbD